MWRYSSVLPEVKPVTLGEGWTPMLPSRRFPNVFIKEEGANPTSTFKSRGLALAVTMARHYGLKKLAVPSAGNAAGALAAYAAAAGIEAHIFMPQDVPLANYVEAVVYGANVNLVDGLISDCGRIVAERNETEGWFDMSTLKEPFRIEGKKTMGYELVEQMGWEYPDAMFYPTGGGVGMIGMWKSFSEMEELGWVRPGKRPRMIAVQSSGCAPVVPLSNKGPTRARCGRTRRRSPLVFACPNPTAIPSCSKSCARRAVWHLLSPMSKSWRRLLTGRATKGFSCRPKELPRLRRTIGLLAKGFLTSSDRAVLFNTGGGLKYTDVIAEAMGLQRPSPQV